MGRNNKSMVRQCQERLEGMLRIGESKHQAKLNGTMKEGIYSWSTFNSYLKETCVFAKWAKDTYGVKTLEAARTYADEWLKSREGLSSWTLKLDRSALAKLYQEPAQNFIQVSSRSRDQIQRSRNADTSGDYHFSEIRNADQVDFAKNTGLRRSEMERAKPSDIYQNKKSGNYYIRTIGKGGRKRNALILEPSRILEIVHGKDPDQPIFKRVHSNMDVHGYRAHYASSLYRALTRNIDEIPEKERYRCRGDKKGIVYDRKAMAIVSASLGHNRIDVIASNYLWQEV